MIRGRCVTPPMIMGLYPYIRDGEDRGFKPGLLEEIKVSLICNPCYAEQMLFLAAYETGYATQIGDL